jgi:hypothetical protein
MVYGLLLSVTLSTGYTTCEREEIKEALVWKEVSVMESTPLESTVDWGGGVLGENSFDARCPHPHLSAELRRGLDLWISIITARTILPHFGNKLVGRHSADDFRSAFPTYDFFEVSTKDLEVAYSRTGVKTGGPCEMKQKWYPTNANPRTYFAQGSSAYHSSKYLRDAFNILCDVIRPTARFTRVKPSLIRVDDGDDVLIYDLTSFTSLFHEQRAFLRFLVDYVADTEVEILDSWEGPVNVRLCDLIYEYLLVCNTQPEYSTELLGFDSSVRLCHSVAGFLGVYGNLATCTFPHGIYLASLKDSTEFSWCAGDDAGTSTSNEALVCDSVSRLGVLAEEKVFRASEEGSVALKRPARLIQNHLFTLDNVMWPTFGLLFQDPRFVAGDYHDEVLPAFLHALVPFFISTQTVMISSYDIKLALELLGSIYGQLSLPKEGYLPQVQGWRTFPAAVPVLDEKSFMLDPLERLVDMFYPGYYVSQLVGEPEDEVPVLDYGVEFVDVMKRDLRYLCDMHYVYSERIDCLYLAEEGYENLLKTVRGRRDTRCFMYRFKVIEEPPAVFQNVPFLL